jgi:hypothetical protein
MSGRRSHQPFPAEIPGSAAEGGGSDIAAPPIFIEQSTVDIAGGAGFTPVIGPSSAFVPADPAGNTLIVASVTGLGKAGITGATAAIDFSDNGGVTWTQAQGQPVPGTIGAGLAADEPLGSTLIFRFANNTFPVGGRMFRVSVSPTGAHFQTTVNQGSMIIEELVR